MKCFKGQGTAEASRRGRTILDPSRPVKATISPADPCVNILSQWEERVDLSPAFLADRYTVRLVFRNEEADHIRIG